MNFGVLHKRKDESNIHFIDWTVLFQNPLPNPMSGRVYVGRIDAIVGVFSAPLSNPPGLAMEAPSSPPRLVLLTLLVLRSVMSP